MHWKAMSIKQVIQAIGESFLKQQISFRDAGIGPPDYPLTPIDIMRGFHIGLTYDWVCPERFRELSELDCSWVVPRRILACASPSATYSS